ncbi:hypothetical protein GALMADRAFT_390556 [Galerina marginata CBS 339.88]|uniref:F-box domain-containing protein n=1 Tax=Galerina marginata (strain CBS 339.88) TaxID=685588 RepID=A0A067TU55_GALM3|nr:hypothetical protein GALMADRAFT_390556 [Galerina marginata CBS 339.88]
MIFERTIPPHFLVDSSTSFSINSVWCRVQQQKNSIVNVCRTWYTVGIPFLYADVSIRRVYQLPNLLRTLNNSSPNLNLKETIRSVHFYCVVPVRYEQQFERQLKVLFDICPRITSCSFASQWSPFCLPDAAPWYAVVPNITHLYLHYTIEADLLERLVEVVSHYLLSLSFRVPGNHSSVAQIPPRNFTHLEDLTVWVATELAVNYTEAVTRAWKMPHLKRLTVQGELPEGALQHLCEAYGTGLQYLHITAHIDTSWAWYLWETTPLPDLLVLCPVLEHIVLSPQLFGTFEHKCIKWIDIWTSAEYGGDVDEMKTKIASWKLPALNGVRTLPYDLHELPLTVPFLIPPTLVSNALETFSIEFLDVVIRHEVGKLSYIQQGLAGGADKNSDGDSSDESFALVESGGSSVSDWEADSDGYIDGNWDAMMDNLEIDLALQSDAQLSSTSL